MKLYLTATSERGKPVTKSGNDYINVELTVHKQVIGSIELYLNHDTEDGECTTDEWILNFYRGVEDEDTDPMMIAQGNIEPQEELKTWYPREER